MAVATEKARKTIGMANAGVNSAKNSMMLLQDLIDSTIPWEEFRNTMQALNDSKDQFSTKAATVVGQVAKLLLDCGDRYMSSVNAIDKWCKSAVPSLKGFMGLFAKTADAKIAEAQKKLLLGVLNRGNTAIAQAIEELKKSQTDFNDMTAKLLELDVIFRNDFDKESEYFEQAKAKVRTEAYLGALAGAAFFGPIGLAISYSTAVGVVEGNIIPNLLKAFLEVKEKFQLLKSSLTSAGVTIDKAKNDISNEIKALNEISAQIETTENFADAWSVCPKEWFDDLKDATETLIKMCKDYSTKAEQKRVTQWN